MEAAKTIRRDWMSKIRAAQGLSVEAAAKCCGISAALLMSIESGWTTLPALSVQIAQAYGMTAVELAEITCQATLERHIAEDHPDATEYKRHMKYLAGLNGARPEPTMCARPAKAAPARIQVLGIARHARGEGSHRTYCYAAPDAARDETALGPKGCGWYYNAEGTVYKVDQATDGLWEIYRRDKHGYWRSAQMESFNARTAAVTYACVQAQRLGWTPL